MYVGSPSLLTVEHLAVFVPVKRRGTASRTTDRISGNKKTAHINLYVSRYNY